MRSLGISLGLPGAAASFFGIAQGFAASFGGFAAGFRRFAQGFAARLAVDSYIFAAIQRPQPPGR